MSNKEKAETEVVPDERPREPEPQGELEELPDVGEMVPKMDINLPADLPQQLCPISDEKLVGLYDKVLDEIDSDRTEVSDMINNMAEMVFNDGDATTASKEALVKLLELKLSTADRRAKIADLMTRVKLRERDTYKAYLNAHQTNTVVFQDSKRDVLRDIMDERKKLKEKK